ncbi:DNA polymerase III subunit delta [Bacteroidota bacterium]|nr:DNA polymerase III subunit delta [Bacteroidota bacterium]
MKKEFTEVMRELKSKIYHPIYFLEGEEAYYIDSISNFIEQKVLNDSEKSFNQFILYGKDTSINQINDYARGYPMMGTYQVVIVKEAQNFKADEWEKLLPYFEKPLKSTILVICHKHKKLDKRNKSVKKIVDHSVFLTADKIYDSKLPQWIITFIKEEGLKISEPAAALMAEFVGNDLNRIATEIEKLIINIPKEKTIDVDDITKNIGLSREYNSFELQRALAFRDVLKANRIINYFASNQKNNPAVLVTGTLFGYFQKVYVAHSFGARDKNTVASAIGINPFFADEYLTAMKNFPPLKTEQVLQTIGEYEMKFKGVNSANTSQAELMKEMIFKILH